MIGDADRDALKAAMPDVLRLRFGVRDLRRPFRCPSSDHDDRDPSAHYYERGFTVHCFGCGRTWDVFSLVGEADGIEGFAERARAVAGLVGYRLDERPACLRAYDELYRPGNEAGRRYLRWRGLDDADAARYGLGFCRDPRHVMPQFRVWEPRAAGFIAIPFWGRDFAEARYAMVRTIGRGDVRNKEWRPKGVASPLWREWMLSAGLPVVYVAEGLIDAMALEKLTGKPVMALGGMANAGRLASVLWHEPPSLRPRRVVVCMDEDGEGRRARERIAGDLDRIGVPHAALPPYPGGAKDADEWLMAGRGRDWDWGRDGGLYRTRWRDGG